MNSNVVVTLDFQWNNQLAYL